MLKKYFFIAVIALSFVTSAFSRTYSMRKAPKVIGQEVEKQLCEAATLCQEAADDGKWRGERHLHH